jgi:hypothetical protein
MSDILTDQELHDFQLAAYKAWPEGTTQRLDAFFRHVVALKKTAPDDSGLLEKYIAYYVEFTRVVKEDITTFLETLDTEDEGAALYEAIDFLKLIRSSAIMRLDEEGLDLGTQEEESLPIHEVEKTEISETVPGTEDLTPEALERSEQLTLMLTLTEMKKTLAAKLEKEGVKYLGELIRKTEEELMEFSRFGAGKVNLVNTFLGSLGLRLDMDAYEITAWVEDGPELNED